MTTPSFGIIGLLILIHVFAGAIIVQADDAQGLSDGQIIERAKSNWESGATTPALEVLDQGIETHPEAVALHKLRGDILATSRASQEALQAYDAVLGRQPAALDVRWAKWSLLVRSGHGEESIEELRRIAAIDTKNPLVYFRLARELRKLDRLEASLESYKQAVTMAPDMYGWRLALARARFDVLDYEGAANDVQYVLDHIPPGSPLEVPANTLVTVFHGHSQDRGRRFDPVFTPRDITPDQLKEWALMRADAWRMFSAGRYTEAEPMYRKLLELNPRDPSATHQFGLTLMQLGKCEEALPVFGKVSDLDPTEDQYSDIVFRMGQCLVELQRWEEAFMHFHILYEQALEFEIQNKDNALPPGTLILDKNKLLRWLDKVRPHIPAELAAIEAETAATMTSAAVQQRADGSPTKQEVVEVIDRLKPERVLDTGGALVGRDADFSWFRFVIPAAKVMRDDLPTGQHDFIPLNPSDSFPSNQRDIYLVFRLVSDSYDAVPLATQCYLETAEIMGPSPMMAQDQVLMAMSDQSGYFRLTPPEQGWTPGLYRCGLFAGERTSAYTQADEVRFRILQQDQTS
ncbi:MAG TPA: tetratricopeptide repeat protein [Nitrospira sp.]|nr:tetratricopeptide repeat protein [Nitrospira sp.]